MYGSVEWVGWGLDRLDLISPLCPHLTTLADGTNENHPIPHTRTRMQESVELLEQMVHEYVGEMCRQVTKALIG